MVTNIKVTKLIASAMKLDMLSFNTIFDNIFIKK